MPSSPGKRRRVVGAPSGAPPPVGPYSPGVEAGGWLFLSGQIALDSEGRVVPGGIAAEARVIFDRLGKMLAQAGYDPSDVVKLTLYLTDLSAFQAVNDACAAFFREPYPARTTVGVAALPRGVGLEVDVIAWKDCER